MLTDRYNYLLLIWRRFCFFWMLMHYWDYLKYMRGTHAARALLWMLTVDNKDKAAFKQAQFAYKHNTLLFSFFTSLLFELIWMTTLTAQNRKLMHFFCHHHHEAIYLWSVYQMLIKASTMWDKCQYKAIATWLISLSMHLEAICHDCGYICSLFNRW